MLRALLTGKVRGFTLVELIVSVSIMMVVLTITLMQRPSVAIRLSLSDGTSNIDLLLRESQLQGSAINAVNGTVGGAGAFFDLSTSTKALKFRDVIDPSISSALGVGNGLYEPGVDLKDSEVTLSQGNKIAKLCVSAGTSTFSCNEENDPDVEDLTISFKRPKTTAAIYINGATTTAYGAACIELHSIKAPETGHVRSIYIFRSGMITKRIGACTTI